MNKKALRMEHKQIIKQLPSAQRADYDNKIHQQIHKHIQQLQPQMIGGYYATPYEVNITPLFKKYVDQWSFPYFDQQTKQLSYIHNPAGLDMSHRVMRPLFDINKQMIPELLLIPVLAINMQGYRLGYGGGYFDRYLAEHPEIITCGIAYPEQITNISYQEAHDRQLDFILLPEQIITI